MSMATPHLILFEDADFHGAHKHVFGTVSFLDDFNDVTSSFIIFEGAWELYLDADFNNPTGEVFGPGAYSWVGDWGVTNNAISSVRIVGP